jgi:xanthine/CO dehydrogenase XdhC/CoxF family maturation factor
MTRIDEDDRYEDGNAMAGPLREIFAVDVTTAATACVGCGRRAAVAELRVYQSTPGLVARCSGCDAVVLRLVRGPDRAWLDLTGTVTLRLNLAD